MWTMEKFIIKNITTIFPRKLSFLFSFKLNFLFSFKNDFNLVIMIYDPMQAIEPVKGITFLFALLKIFFKLLLYIKIFFRPQ